MKRLFVLLLLVFTSCVTGTIKKTVTIINSCNSDITITSIEPETDAEFPLIIERGETEKFTATGTQEALELRVVFDGKDYVINSGYVKDSTNVKLEFKEEDDKLFAEVTVGKKTHIATIESE